mgnify:CR=1 FL=1
MEFDLERKPKRYYDAIVAADSEAFLRNASIWMMRDDVSRKQNQIALHHEWLATIGPLSCEPGEMIRERVSDNFDLRSTMMSPALYQHALDLNAGSKNMLISVAFAQMSPFIVTPEEFFIYSAMECSSDTVPIMCKQWDYAASREDHFLSRHSARRTFLSSESDMAMDGWMLFDMPMDELRALAKELYIGEIEEWERPLWITVRRPAEIRDHPKVQEVYFGSGKTFEKAKA